VSTGYSGTPLVRKLGIKAGMRVLIDAAPRPYEQIVPDLPADLELVETSSLRVDLVQRHRCHEMSQR
jgi:hypothetical protein